MMQDMITFCTTILSSIPTFLMAEPICYIVGLCVLSYVINLVMRIRDM